MTETPTTPQSDPKTFGEVLMEAVEPSTAAQHVEIQRFLVELQSAFADAMQREVYLPALNRLEANELIGKVLDARDAVRRLR